MKKKILLGLALVSVVLLSVGGTVAFLTDAETSTDVYTIGDIDIELLQEEGTDGKVLLMPGQKFDPKARIKNIGNNDAYVWMTVKIPASLDMEDNSADNVLHWNLYGKYLDVTYQNDKYKENGVTTVTYEETWRYPADENNKFDLEIITDENGIKYHLYTFLYNGILSPEKETGTILNGAYLDVRVDYNHDTGKWVFVENGEETELEHDFNKGAAMEINAYAIQAETFNSVDEAYAAYKKQRSSN